jgi:hypothetical protein
MFSFYFPYITLSTQRGATIVDTSRTDDKLGGGKEGGLKRSDAVNIILQNESHELLPIS